MPRQGRPHKVVVLALDHAMTFDLGIPQRIFEAAACRDGQPPYEIMICTPAGAPVRTTSGMLHPEGQHGVELLATADTVVVPSLQAGSAISDGVIAPVVRDALIDAARHARLMSICTGAFVLAATGLLSGRPATTHWRYVDRFRRLFPDVRLAPDVLFVDDDDVLSSAGGGAGIDLCLHVVRRDYGSEVANHAARTCVVPPWRHGGQAQFIERPLPEFPEDSTSPARAWALANLHQPLDLRGMADQSRMSVRTFTRRFRSETGMSPTEWLLERRVERARYLLESTSLPVDRVAHEAGFGTPAALRARFRCLLSVSPSTYRNTFRYDDAGDVPRGTLT